MTTETGVFSRPRAGTRRSEFLPLDPRSGTGADAVAAAVRLYLAIRRNPLRWRDVLREHNLVERAEKKPLAVLTQLLWPDLDSQWQRRRASAIAWSLEQLDLCRIDVAQVSFALNAAGGVREVHRCWRSAKEETLYGAD